MQKPLNMLNRLHQRDWLFPFLLITAVALLFFGAPNGGAFYWSDAPRHALNGVFVADLARTMPLHDPSAYAYAYYAQYPALTILFYPPLFYLFSAPFYWIFGVSHGTALLAVFVLYAIFVVGCYRLCRFWLEPCVAALAAAALASSPEIAFWGRQVMLEVPAFSPLVWSAVCFLRFRKSGRALQLYLAALLLVLAMYTKISVGFMAPVFVLSLLATQRSAFRTRHPWIVSALSAIALVPLIVLTLKFGQANVQSVSGIADAEVSRHSLSGWLWYLNQIPLQLGWPFALTALAGVLAAIVLRKRGSLDTGDAVFLGLWFLVGYVFFSLIDLKEARHSVFILPPLAIAAFALIGASPQARLKYALAVMLYAAVFMQTVFWRPVLYVDGYAKVVQEIARLAPPDSAVLFSGYRDGSFIFNVRASNRPDLSVVRADKILLRFAVRRELGVEQKSLSEEDIASTLDKLGVHYVVMQPGFWTDLEAMRRFEHVLASPHFERVTSFPTPANYDAAEKELVIYRNLGQVAAKAGGMDIELPMINRTIPANPQP